MESPVLLENMLFIYPLYKQDGTPIVAPQRNRMISVMQAA